MGNWYRGSTIVTALAAAAVGASRGPQHPSSGLSRRKQYLKNLLKTHSLVAKTTMKIPHSKLTTIALFMSLIGR